jgi:hypothetical protein
MLIFIVIVMERALLSFRHSLIELAEKVWTLLSDQQCPIMIHPSL